MKKECEQIELLLSPYLEDDLSLQEKQEVEDHLKTCRECAELYVALQTTLDTLGDLPELELNDELKDQLYKIEKKKSKFRSKFKLNFNFDFLKKPSFQPIMAVTTIFMIALSFYTFHPDKHKINKAIERQLHIGYSKIGRIFSKAESFTDSLWDQKETLLASLENVRLFGDSEE